MDFLLCILGMKGIPQAFPSLGSDVFPLWWELMNHWVRTLWVHIKTFIFTGTSKNSTLLFSRYPQFWDYWSDNISSYPLDVLSTFHAHPFNQPSQPLKLLFFYLRCNISAFFERYKFWVSNNPQEKVNKMLFMFNYKHVHRVSKLGKAIA